MRAMAATCVGALGQLPVPAYSQEEAAAQIKAANDLQTRLQVALTAGDKHVTIPPGIYRFRSNLDLNALDGVTIAGQGAEFIFTAGKVRLMSCKGTTLKNLFLDVAHLPFIQGTVVALDPEQKTADMKIDPGYPTRDTRDRKENLRCVFFDPNGERELEVIDTSTPPPVELSPGVLRISSRRIFDLEKRPLATGDKVALSVRTGAGGVSVTDSANVTLEDITIYAAGAFAFTEGGFADGGNTYRRCRVIRRPGSGRLMAGASDGFHSITQKRGPHLTGCEISHCFDDLANIHGFFSLTLERKESGAWLIAGPYGQDFAAGSLLRFYRAPNAEPIGEARIVSCERRDTPAKEEVGRMVAEHFKRTCKTTLRSFPNPQPCEVVLDREIPVEPYDFVSCAEFGGRGAIIEDCYFHDGHVRGVLLKSSGSLIARCRFERLARSGVVVAPEMYWLEGPFPHSVRIEENSFVDCGFGAVSKVERSHEFAPLQVLSAFAGRLSPPMFSSAVNMSQIRCTGNRIVRAPGPGILIANAAEIELTGNSITGPGSKSEAAETLDLTRSLPPDAVLTDAERDAMRRPFFGILLVSVRGARGNGNRVEGGHALVGKGWGAKDVSVSGPVQNVTGETALVNSLGMRLLPIEPGSFEMGQDGPQADYKMWAHPDKCDDADWDERPVHQVTIGAPFCMSATEVTNAQYRQFKPDHREGQGEDDEAITFVSWQNAVKFCEWLSAKENRPYRLPTEAEWEYGCRAGTTTLFHTGERLPDGFQKWIGDKGRRDRYFKDKKLPPEYREAARKGALRVGQTAANAWGMFDMHGNVEEWCLDWYGPYEAIDQTDPVGRSDGDFRVTRGGSHSEFARLLRSANRSGRLPETANDKIGFRVVLGNLPATKPLPPAPPPLNARDVSQQSAEWPAPSSEPFFSGPRSFVKVPPDSFGPMFSSHNHSPAIAQCPNGNLLAVWYSCVDEAGSELCVLASRLRRGAQEWEGASPFWDGPDVNDHAPKLWFDGDRTLFFFARGMSENVLRTSTDNGVTWSKASILHPFGEFANMPIRTREGFLIVPHDSRSTSLVISRDGGRTWTSPEVGKRTHDYRPGGKGYRLAGIHNGIVQRQDGRLMTMGRFDKPEDQERFGFRTPVSFSSDWGETWTYEASPFPAISSVQRQVLMRLAEGPLLFCSYTDQWRDWKNRKGMSFPDAAGGQFTGYGLFAALSFDDGKTWPVRKLLTPDGPARTVNGIDRVEFTLSDTSVEPCGYLAACQTPDGMIQLISSRNHYVFNLPWLKQRPAPARDQ